MGFLGLIFLAGCASSSSYVAVGHPRTPITADQVQVVDSVPANAEKLGIIDGEANHVGQGATDSIIRKMKKSSAQLGANYLVIDKNEVLHGYGVVAHVSGTAYFAP